MQKRTREIIALVLLMVLGIAGIAAMAWYIMIGHSWNETASNIDDHIGAMDGYTVIMYEGTVPSRTEQYRTSINQPMLEEQNFGEPDSRVESTSAEAVEIADAVDAYVEKGAEVVSIDLADRRFYEDPVIVPRNGLRIGIFSPKGTRPDLVSQFIAKQLRTRYAVDFVICIIDDLASLKRGVGDVDLAICTDYELADSKGDSVNRTYVVGSPFVGGVGMVVVAPSGYISSKEVEGL